MAAILRAESAPDLTTQFSELFSGQIHLSKPIAELKHTYGNAKPFPYLVMDDLFSPALLGPLQSEITRLRNDKWLRIENESMQKVDRMRSGMDLGEAGIRLIHLLHSAGFLYLLSEITGVWQLLPDPYLQGAG
jgi:hypothetical protein